MTAESRPPHAPESEDLRIAFERRGEELVAQRLRFTDQLADLVRENEELQGLLTHERAQNQALSGEIEALRAHAARLESSIADYDASLKAAHSQLEAEHAMLSFRVAHRLRRLTGRADNP